MDIQKEIAVFSSVDKKVSLKIKDDESEKGQRALKVDVQHLLMLAPYQKTTEAVKEGIPNGLSSAIDTGKSTSVLHVKQSKVYSEAQGIAKIFGPFPHIGKTCTIEDGDKDEEEKDNRGRDFLNAVGNDSAYDFSSTKKEHKAKGFQRKKTFAVRLLVGLIFSAAAFGMFGKMSHVDVNKDIQPSPDESKMNMDQSVKVILHQDIQPSPDENKMNMDQSAKVISHQIQKRSTKQIRYYKILDPSENCTDGIKQIQDKCQDSEQVVCVRNRTWGDLVAVCIDNIPMNDYCPVFTEAIDEGTTIHVVQEDIRSDCKNCSHYSLWDVEKYPQCLQLEIMDTTTIDSNATTTNSSFVTATPAGKKEDGEGLSRGTIAGIVIGVICFLLVIVCLYRLGCLQNLMVRIFHCLRGIPVGQNVV